MILDFEAILRFYTRKDIQKEIANLSKDREVVASFGNNRFGKRPDVIQFPSDVLELVKNGATSFHISEELWSNPLEIKTGMKRKEMDNLRTGWDCVLDIDSKYFEYSQTTADLVLKALEFSGIKSTGIKFSGNKGFHIIIPSEAFPSSVGSEETRFLFPEGPKKIAAYLQHLIKEKLSEKILEKNTIQQVSKAVKKPVKELTTNNEFNPFTLVDIDTLLISSRHLFRSAYSINEKSGLVSIPINPKSITKFKLKQAKIENVNTEEPFLKKPSKEEATRLLIQAFDQTNIKPFLPPKKSYISSLGKDYFEEKQKKEIKPIEFSNKQIKEEYYPICIKYILNGMKEDGRKRALFILINFFKSLKFSNEQIKQIINMWNQKNYELLREGYIQSQLKWNERQSKSFLPPNCNNESYYKSLGIKCIGCGKVKNPVNYTIFKIKDNKKKTKKTVKKKT